jgi:hypothetical protein
MSCHRPTVGNELVHPSALHDHRQSYRFLGPCCLCPLLAQSGRGVYTEAAILIETSGLYCGEYVAKCVNGECGYIGQSPYVKSNPERTSGCSRRFTLPALIERIYFTPFDTTALHEYPPQGKKPVQCQGVCETDRL